MNEVSACWSCHGARPLKADFCPTCRAIQPPHPGVDHFEVFGLDPGFQVDRDRLETVYRERQRQFHPDLFAAKSAAERRCSMEHVTRVNEGYRALKEPLRRAEYLLALTGQRTATPENATPTDPSFLMEVMELREALEEVEPGAADALSRLGDLRDRVVAACDAEIRALEELFSDHFTSGEAKKLETAEKHTDRLRYHQRFLEELDRREEMAFGG